jgi:hypothetical protein
MNDTDFSFICAAFLVYAAHGVWKMRQRRKQIEAANAAQRVADEAKIAQRIEQLKKR